MTPNCPKCSSPMVVRVARTGKNSGGSFYGCSKYPKCKGTLPFEENDQKGSANENEVGTQIKQQSHSYPRTILARSKHQEYQSRFIESVAVPYPLLEKIRFENCPEYELLQHSQWRLDYPIPTQTRIVDESVRQVLAVAEKILSRGRITLCSPDIEAKISSHFSCDFDKAFDAPAKDYLQSIGTKIFHPNHWFDSPHEELFYFDYLPKVLGDNWFQWVHPQMEISSLIQNDTSNQVSGRVDFLFAYPDQVPIVIEIDGDQHKQHTSADELRDEVLRKAGYKVVRITTSDLNLNQITALFNDILDPSLRKEISTDKASASRYVVQATKIVHQIQIAILQALETGFLNPLISSEWVLKTDLEKIGFFSEQDAKLIFESAIDDLLIVLRTLGNLFRIDICVGKPILEKSKRKPSSLNLSFTNHLEGTVPTFLIQNIYFQHHIANTIAPSTPKKLTEPNKTDVEFFLNYIFRKEKLWEGQFDAISRTLEGKDSIVLLPTGAGKSIAFQLAGFMLPGRSIIIDPLISLMDDQIDNLKGVGVDRCIAITAQIDNPNAREQAIKLFGQGEYLFAYVSPERFEIIEFRESLRSLTTHTPVSLIAIDEAHCVSEWGHDFRDSYLNIGRTSREYCQSNNHIPPLLALTGTASRAVLKDVQRELQIQEFEAIITPKSFDRSELKFEISKSSSSEKSAKLLGYLGKVLPSKFSVTTSTFFQPRGKSTYSGLVFCPHVNGDFGVVTQSLEIQKALHITTAYYSGKEPKDSSKFTYGQLKQETARQFKYNDIPLLISTKAFGMGIDKPNVRYTIHFGIPNSIESLYQEAGRAGRDRKPAQCCLLVSIDDHERAKLLLNPNVSASVVKNVISEIKWEDNDDVTRALFFQTNAFPGIVEEVQKTVAVLDNIGNVLLKTNCSFSVKRDEVSSFKRGLHRLLILGIVDDYTVNYARNEFEVRVVGASKQRIIEAYEKYVKGYSLDRAIQERLKAERFLNLDHRQFVHSLIDLLINFIYDVIEKGRRRALDEMVQLAITCRTDKEIRDRILRYLDTTQFSEELELIINSLQAGLTQVKLTIEKISSPNDAAELRGQVGRYLESYPDHPGLLLLRALSEIKTRDRNEQVVLDNFNAAITFAVEKYGIEKPLLFNTIIWGVKQIEETSSKLSIELVGQMLEQFPERTFARLIIESFDLSLALYPAWLLLQLQIRTSQGLLQS